MVSMTCPSMKAFCVHTRHDLAGMVIAGSRVTKTLINLDDRDDRGGVCLVPEAADLQRESAGVCQQADTDPRVDPALRK